MKHSTDRILTTHAGRLDGPPAFRETAGLTRSGAPIDTAALGAMLPDAIRWVIRQQVNSGVDIVSDGELGKFTYGLGYYGGRLSGLTARPVRAGEPGWMSLSTGERLEFADFYKELQWVTTPERIVCDAPVTYIGQKAVRRDIELLRSGLAAEAVKVEEAFMCVLAPGWLEHFFYNEYYPDDEQYLIALADAIAHEYRAIVEAGFILQIDDPALPDTYDMLTPKPSIDEYRRFAKIRIDALNHALRGLPEERVRYHICWGSWHGPHTHDLPLEHVIDLMLEVKAGAYSVEAANPRHEHEWKLWKQAKLPDGKLLIPGVVSHATNVVEHPEVVADRIIRYANVVGRENVVAGTDCGLGFRVHPQIAWAKLKTLAEGAALATRALWGQ
jgi:5-methyltetrahydropteroyltriglutamate--homocysteine methyltransferase